VRNDAVDNLLGALALAGNFLIPERKSHLNGSIFSLSQLIKLANSLFFHHTLFRGCRSIKSSSTGFE
jgi:hypothetical protein